jgi:hypothetical protein
MNINTLLDDIPSNKSVINVGILVNAIIHDITDEAPINYIITAVILPDSKSIAGIS